MSLPDFNRFKPSQGKLYLHDACRLDPQTPPNERFAITSSREPEETIICTDRSFRKLQRTANYLSRVWRGSAQVDRSALCGCGKMAETHTVGFCHSLREAHA